MQNFYSSINTPSLAWLHPAKYQCKLPTVLVLYFLIPRVCCNFTWCEIVELKSSSLILFFYNMLCFLACCYLTIDSWLLRLLSQPKIVFSCETAKYWSATQWKISCQPSTGKYLTNNNKTKIPRTIQVYFWTVKILFEKFNNPLKLWLWFLSNNAIDYFTLAWQGDVQVHINEINVINSLRPSFPSATKSPERFYMKSKYVQ